MKFCKIFLKFFWKNTWIVRAQETLQKKNNKRTFSVNYSNVFYEHSREMRYCQNKRLGLAEIEQGATQHMSAYKIIEHASKMAF